MTTDTKPMAPTDAELNELADACTPNTETGSLNYRKFARAALAKWGTPAHSGKPWGACVSGRVFVGGLPDHVRKLAEAENLPIQWLYTTPQPTQPQAEPKSGAKSFQTYGEANAYSKGYYAGRKAATQAQAQAGAVPLTDEQRKDLLAASFCIAAVGDPTATIKPDDAERIINLLHEIGGIKGGQHGTDT